MTTNNDINGHLAQRRNDKSVSSRTSDELRLMQARIQREKQSAVDVHKKRIDDLMYEIQRANDHHEAYLEELNFTLANVNLTINNMDRKDEMASRTQPQTEAVDVESELAAAPMMQVEEGEEETA